MFEPIRGGTRGGQGEFKWSDVSADKDREHYLGHSINAPTGRWQKNKDVHWYNRDLKDGEAERLEEIKRVKEAEEDALAVALGFTPAVRNKDPVGDASASPQSALAGGSNAVEDARLKEEEEKRLLKAEKKAKKAEKKAKKEARRLERGREHDSGSEHDRPHREREGYRGHGRSRSRSPRRGHDSPEGGVYSHRRRSPVPSGRRSVSPVERLSSRGNTRLDVTEMERERERDRRRWDANARRYEGSDSGGRRYH